MVRKADGTWRPCGDYRRLNGVTIPDTYPLPNMMDFTAKASGCTVFSKIDLRKGYHQIPMRAADIAKTAIITPFGLFEYTRMTFGMRNAGNTFQRLMDRVTHGLAAVFVYLDDLFIASPSPDQHWADLVEVFDRLEEAGLVINAEKCLFAVPSLDFLGHHVSAAGITPLPGRVAALRAHPPPTTVKELQGFLGAVNFYRRFLPAAAKVLRPLTDSLRGGASPNSPVAWSEAMQLAFQGAKDILASATLLAHPRTGAELALVVDASAAHVGAALQQRLSPTAAWQPLGFFSKKLEPAQTRYSAFDRELLACVEGIRHFRWMLEARPFTIYTDHKPLTFAIHKVAEPWTARQARHLSYIAEFSSDVRHVAGVDNVVADTLSRPPVPGAVAAVPAADSSLDLAAIAEAQRTCPAVAAADSSSLKLQLIRFGDVRVLCDTSLEQPRPFIPLSHRRLVFAALHGLAHPGMRASRRLLAERVVWEGMNKDVNAWCRDCQPCSRAKVHRQPAAAVQPIAVPKHRFTHVHLDLVGPLMTAASGHRIVLTIIDRTTRWLEAVPLRTADAAACVDAFISCWVARFGVPAIITSDQGRQFTSAVWARLCQLLGVHSITTTAYHPQSNGMIERPHRQLKNALRARLATHDWPEHLPWVLLGLRAAPKEDSGISSAELLYGAALTLPGQFLSAAEPPIPELLEQLRATAPLPTRPTPAAPPEPLQQLQQAAFAYVRRGAAAAPLAPLYSGPYRVLQRGPKTFKLQVGGREEVVTVDRLKPHLGSAPVEAAEPPRRGRPPAMRDGRSYAAVVTGGGCCSDERNPPE